jgi:ferredoxin
MKVRIDRNKCFMAGECFYNHPELFRMGEDGYPEVIADVTTAELRRHADEAIEVCPAGAISLEE